MNAFENLTAANVMPLQVKSRYGVGFKIRTDAGRCEQRSCLLASGHAVAFGNRINDGFGYPSSGSLRLAAEAAEYDKVLDLAVVRMRSETFARWDGRELERDDKEIAHHIKSLREWDLAPPDSVEVGSPVRVVTYDFILDGDQGLVLPVVLPGHVSHYEPGSNRFMLYVNTINGNSGGVVLNERMQVIGMVIGGYRIIDRFTGVGVDIPSRAVAVHVDAIRVKLCEWEFLIGSDCR